MFEFIGLGIMGFLILCLPAFWYLIIDLVDQIKRKNKAGVIRYVCACVLLIIVLLLILYLRNFFEGEKLILMMLE